VHLDEPALHRATPPRSRGVAAVGRFLEMARDRLGAQSASLLLANDSGAVLEPYASIGLAQSVRAASRIPVGQGFAGRIALSRQPLSVDVSAESVINPVLRSSGIRSVLGVPLETPGHRLLGVLHVGSTSTRTFGAADVAALASVAADLVEALGPEAEDRIHQAALVLQRSLLPTTPRRIGALETAARYVPAEGDLGGDWYDVFSLPDGGVGLVMGDVVGHGLPAAVVMGRLRSALRAYALDDNRPDRVLARLDRKIRHFEDGACATVAYGVLHPPFDAITISSAGHWPPLLAVPGRETLPVEITQDPMLGVAEFDRHHRRVELPPGAVLCFYTDGLVERPWHGSAVDGPDPDATLEAVRSRLRVDDDPETTCSRIIGDVVGDDVVDDDVALLVVRRTA